jgi:arylsulfatase K
VETIMMAHGNILFIHTDSMDGRAMGCMGHPSVVGATPNLDSLAEEGVLFRNAYSNNPICCPSRASMWSGRFTHKCEGWNNFKGLEQGAHTFMDDLQSASYQFQSYGKVDIYSGAHTVRARVSPWTRSANILRTNYNQPAPSIIDDDSERVHETDWNDVDNTLNWLGNEWNREESPFCVYLGIRAPHPVFRTSRRYLDMIAPECVEIPGKDREIHPVMAYQLINKGWSHGLDDEMVRMVRCIYFAMIAEVDAMVGCLLDGLEEMGLRDTTTIIFSSDHGECAMEHNQYFKMNMYEPSAHVPLIMSGPDVTRGATVDAPVSLVDIYPTLMDLAGCPHPEGLDGHSLMPEATGADGSRPDWALSEFHGTTSNTGAFMLRRGDWKYIAYPGYGPMLFNLVEDPNELENVAVSQPEVADEMDRILRSVVDYEEVDAKVKAYDRESFRAWREEQKKAGVYEELMAQVFCGWDDVAPEDLHPWAEHDEAQLEAWLGEESVGRGIAP